MLQIKNILNPGVLEPCALQKEKARKNYICQARLRTQKASCLISCFWWQLRDFPPDIFLPGPWEVSWPTSSG